MAKVTDAKYAEMILDGDVYARPLNAFGVGTGLQTRKTTYLIHGKWWSGHSIGFATNSPKGITRLENLVIDTRNEIRDYRTPVVSASMTIY